MDWLQLQQANESIKTTKIKGKDYAEVNQRIKAFRMVFPEGYIATEMLENEEDSFGGGHVCVFRASVGFYGEDGEVVTLGVGHAYEKETSSYINKTSYIENCETSAVGRALGMAGFGIDTSVASYEEVANAIKQQTDMEIDNFTGYATDDEIAEIRALIKQTEEHKGKPLNTAKWLNMAFKKANLEELTYEEYLLAKERLTAELEKEGEQ